MTAASGPSPPKSTAPRLTEMRATVALPGPRDGLRRFVETVTAPQARDRDGSWLGGIREYIPDAGPVPSNRFL